MIDVSIYYYVYTYFCGERERGGKNHPSGTTVQTHQKDQRSHTYRFHGKQSLDIRRSHQSCIKLRQKTTGRWGRSNKTCSTKSSEVVAHALKTAWPHRPSHQSWSCSIFPACQEFSKFRFWDARMPNLYCKNVHPTFGNKKSSSRTSISKGERIPNRPIHRSIAGGLLSPASSSASVKAGSPGARLLFTCSVKGAARCDMKLHPNEKRQMMENLVWGSEIYNFRVNQAHNKMKRHQLGF